MQRLDLEFTTPADHLAADEALLDWCEGGHAGEVLAFWEPPEPFVVVGYANKVAAEVNITACEQKGVPIFRRCSGGGAVVQMPGGLNYSLILRITDNGPTRNISSANQFIMERNRAAIQSLLDGKQWTVSIRGHTDLTLAAHGHESGGGGHGSAPINRKFAGNSQRRRKYFLLFHGTLLLNCDLKWIGELLHMPSLQPDYRTSRPHGEFVTNLNLSAATVKTALTRAWRADGLIKDLPLAEIKKLAREKYAARDWNYKF